MLLIRARVKSFQVEEIRERIESRRVGERVRGEIESEEVSLLGKGRNRSYYINECY
jgi:hypothetical protein